MNETKVQTRTFPIKGMHCASCANRIEKVLQKVDGVVNASVNYATEKATVRLYGKGMDQKLEEAVKSVGYNLIVPQNRQEASQDEGGQKEPDDEERKERQKELSILRRKLVIGAILSIAIFIGTYAVWPHWLLFLLTLPVQFWVGWQFYRGLVLLVKYRTADMNTLISIGTLAAFLYSAAATFFPAFFEGSGLTPEVYFDTAAAIVTLILLGKFLELRAKGQASEAIKKLMGLQPKEATVLLKEDDQRLKTLKTQTINL